MLEPRACDELSRNLAKGFFILCEVVETAGPKWIDSYQGLGYRTKVKIRG